MVTYQFAQIKAPKDPAGSKSASKTKSSGSGSSSDFEKKHPRGKTGSGQGGQFVALSYDSKTNTGTGYGSKQGDSRVKKLQTALNRLGLKDKNGKPLVIDGKLGPLTTSSIIAAQKKLGIKPADGKVTPALLKQLTGAKTLAGVKTAHSQHVAHVAHQAHVMHLAHLRRTGKPLKPKKPKKPKKPPKFDGKPPLKPAARKVMPWERTRRRPPGNYRPNAPTDQMP